MPTNILRKRSDQRAPDGKQSPTSAQASRDHGSTAGTGSRLAILTAGRIKIQLAFAATPTADLVWNALPLHSSAETWGRCIQFETPLEAGRDRTARILAQLGEIYFWVEHDRIVVPFGPTPISRPGEIRLQSPCNVFAHALGDLTALSAVSPAEKVSLTAL